MTVQQMIDLLQRLPKDCKGLQVVFEQDSIFRETSAPEVVHVTASGKITLEPTMFRYVDISGMPGPHKP